jgi:hypothetical protein
LEHLVAPVVVSEFENADLAVGGCAGKETAGVWG